MKLYKLVDSYKEEIVNATRKFIKIKSVQGKPEQGMPFGRGPHEALKYVLDLGAGIGFNVKNIDGYAGHLEYGDGDETLGILIHVDVVPDGDGWTYPPFEGVIHDGKLFGRGALDDKGPTIAVLYALKAVREAGVKLSKRVRVIFGADEETGMKGMEYYLSKEKAFEIGFTPDASFPVINGEKGILVIKLRQKFENRKNNGIKIISIKGGDAVNVVPGLCTAEIEVPEEKKQQILLKLNSFIKKYGYEINLEEKSGGYYIICKGKSVHASTPEEGINSISMMLMLLNELDFADSDVKSFIRLYNRKIGMEYNGESAGCGFEDGISGKLTLNVGTINFREESAEVSIDIRYPISCNCNKVADGIKKEFESMGVDIEVVENENPIYLPEDHFIVQKLMKVYGEITGDLGSKPIIIGGGTYARAMKNIVAFGPVFPGEEELAHQKDEYIEVEALIRLTKIYAKAIYELAK